MSGMVTINAGEVNTQADAWASRLSAIAGELRGKYTITLEVPTEVALRVTWFEGGSSRSSRQGHPFTTIQGPALTAAMQALQTHVYAALSTGGTLDYEGGLVLAGDALQGVFVGRLGNNGGDLRFAPVSSRYALAKSRRGQGSRTGVATGETLRALSSGRVVVTRRS